MRLSRATVELLVSLGDRTAHFRDGGDVRYFWSALYGLESYRMKWPQ